MFRSSKKRTGPRRKTKRHVAVPPTHPHRYFLQLKAFVVPFKSVTELNTTLLRCKNLGLSARVADLKGEHGKAPNSELKIMSHDLFLKKLAAKERDIGMSPLQILHKLTPKGRLSFKRQAKASKKTATGRPNPTGTVGLKPDAANPRKPNH